MALWVDKLVTILPKSKSRNQGEEVLLLVWWHFSPAVKRWEEQSQEEEEVGQEYGGAKTQPVIIWFFKLSFWCELGNFKVWFHHLRKKRTFAKVYKVLLALQKDEFCIKSLSKLIGKFTSLWGELGCELT